MFELNGTYVIFIASFLVFLVLLNEVMLKPVGKVLEMRKTRINEDLEAAKQSRAQAEQVLVQYENDIAKTRAEAQRLINEATSSAQKVRDEKLKEVQEQGRKKIDQAKAELQAERDRLLDGLVEQEIELVKDIATKVMGEPVTVSVDRQKVRKTLEEAC